jgi:hypothetical protein
MSARETKLRQREVAVAVAERQLAERAERFAAEQPERYPPNPNFFGSIRQEPH